MMDAIHGQPPTGPIQPNTLSHPGADVLGLHLGAEPSSALILATIAGGPAGFETDFVADECTYLYLSPIEI